MSHSNGNGKKSNGSTLNQQEAEKIFNEFLLLKRELQIYEMGIPYLLDKAKYKDWFMILKKDDRPVFHLRIDSVSKKVSCLGVK
jgi:hypothetical protein